MDENNNHGVLRNRVLQDNGMAASSSNAVIWKINLCGKMTPKDMEF